MGTTIEQYKAKPPRIEGSTTINHNLRVSMRLTPTEYILMDCFSEIIEKNEAVTDHAVYVKTGISPTDQVEILRFLVSKGYIYPKAGDNNNPVISDKWKDFFKGIEEEFAEFWSIGGKSCWQGSKPMALKLYTALRKTKSKEFIIQRRNVYFEFLELSKQTGFDRGKMMATVFLGKQERYNEDWKRMSDEISEKLTERKKEEEMDYPEPSLDTAVDRAKRYEN